MKFNVICKNIAGDISDSIRFAIVMCPTEALVLRPQWARKILEGTKQWELRGYQTHKFRVVALAASGTGTLVGEAHIEECFILEPHRFAATFPYHQVDPQTLADLNYKVVYAWVLRDPVTYDPPRPYRHKKGAVSWVRLDEPGPASSRSSKKRPASRR